MHTVCHDKWTITTSMIMVGKWTNFFLRTFLLFYSPMTEQWAYSPLVHPSPCIPHNPLSGQSDITIPSSLAGMERTPASCDPSHSLLSVDDSQVDYDSLLGLEERRRRFSEALQDEGLRETIRLGKKLRQIQRNVYFRNQMLTGVAEVFFCQG